MSTYIKLYRAVLDHSLLSNDNTAYLVFTKVLLKVDWKTGKYRTGRKKLGLLTNLKDTTAWQALKRLENDGAVTLVTTGRFTDIYISNWWKYQGESEKTDDRSKTHEKQSTDTKQEQKKKEIIYTDEEMELLALVNKITGRNFESLTAASKASLAEFGIEQIEKALKNLIMDDWHTAQVMKTAGLGYFLKPGTIRRFLPSNKSTPPKPSIQIGGVATKKSSDHRENLSRKELQAIDRV